MNNLKKLLILIIIGLAVFGPTLVVFAQEKTDEATSSSESIKEIMKNADLKKVNGAINNLLNKKVAMIGEVARITDESITITNILGTRILALNNNPKIIKNKEIIGVEKVEVENWVMVLGKLEEDNFSPHFIYVSTETLRPKNQEVIMGTITSISNSELKISNRSGNEEQTLKLSKNTNYQNSNGEEVSASNFSKDLNVLVTAFIDDSSTTVATLRSLAALSDE